MKNINDSELFIYTGNSMEPWAKKIIDSMDSDCKILNCSDNIKLINSDEFFHEYSILEENDEPEESNHSYEFDGHIWLNPKNAIIMVDTICDALCELDYENSSFYKNNAEDYKSKLLKLDAEIEKTIESEDINTLVFGGEFSYAYFMERYGIKVLSAYTACGEEAEPSVSRIKEIIDYINANNVKIVFYEDLSEGTVAKMISEETQSKPMIFYSIHNVSKEQINAGEDYISIMKKNLESIKEAKK